jgi:MFS family permease
MAPMIEKRWLRVIPIAFVMYTIAYIDRTNISLALPSMTRDLHLTHTEAGNAVGIFFWGYLLLQIPAGYLAERWSAKHLISILLVAWGASSMVTALVHGSQGFLSMRFLLGVTEGGVWPATLVLLSNWFPRRERARANGYWMLCIPAAIVLSSPLSGWILGRWNWRVLLVVEGAFPLLWLVIWWAAISDYPRQAPWISMEERDFLEKTIGQEKETLHLAARDSSSGSSPRPSLVRVSSYLRALLRPPIILMTLLYFLENSGNYGYLFWLPSVIDETRRISDLRVGLLFCIPYAMVAAGLIVISRHSDQTGDRARHYAFALAWGSIFLIASVLTLRVSPALSFFLVAMVGFGSYGGKGLFWAIPSETLPPNIAGTAIGVINSVGNLSGWFGPFLIGYLRQRTGSFVYPFALLSLGWLVASALGLFFLPQTKFQTRHANS